MRKDLSYSIWLMPEGEVYNRLAGITDMLSKKYGSPKIRSHVTLLGGFTGNEKELKEKAHNLAKRIVPFKIKLTRVNYFDEFFRSLFILVERSDKFMESYETARKIFDMPQNPGFVPHLSLIYGNFNAEEKEKMIKKIGYDFDMTFKVRKIHLVFNNEQQLTWSEIAAFPLK